MQKSIIQEFCNWLVVFATNYLMETMLIVFVLGSLTRWLVWFTVRCQHQFVQELEKRAYRYLATPDSERVEAKISSFYQLLAAMLKKTFIEIYELKRVHRRRTLDPLTSMMDRIFLVQEGAIRVIRDSLKQSKYFRKDLPTAPKFIDQSKFIFGTNPVFNRVLGFIPVGLCNEILNILPGMFIVGGIFGTFLGIMEALPALRGMELGDAELTKKVMDEFLIHIAFSMNTSIVGIILSVIMTMQNTIFSAEGLFLETITKFTSTLEYIWNETTSNDVGEIDYEDWANTVVNPVKKRPAKRAESDKPTDQKNVA